MTSQDLLYFAKKQLKDVSTQAYQESLWILSHILKSSVSDLFLKKNDVIGKDDEQTFLDCIKKRQQGWPLDYVLGEKDFMGHKFFVKPHVFIPRDDSEVLIHKALELNLDSVRGIDFGSGSGALAISFLKSHSNSQFLSVEINPQSIKCLHKNRRYHGLQDRLQILDKDVSHLEKQEVEQLLKQSPNLILANPPYIKANDKHLEDQVCMFESPLALFSDQEGMGHIISWFEKSMELLSSKGVYIFEFGYDQNKKVTEFLNQRQDLEMYHIYKDQSGVHRTACCIKK